MTNILMYTEQPDDFKQAVVAVCCYCQWGKKYLFLKKAEGQQQANKWVAPGGKVENGEILTSAMERELFEETGIVWEGPFHPLGSYFFRKPDYDFMLQVYHFKLSKKPEVILSDEHDEARWLTLDEALALPLIDGADLLIKQCGVYGR